MGSRERILEAAMAVFGRYGYRMSSMELVAQESGLTRQALYHHFDSKEALFRAVVEAVHQGAYAAEEAAGLERERDGSDLAEILAAQIEARYRYLGDCLKGSAQAEELLSEQQRQTRDLQQSFIEHKMSLLVGTIERVRAAKGLTLRPGMTPVDVARCIQLVTRGFDLQQTDASLLSDLRRTIRLLVAGALPAAPSETGSQHSRSPP